MSTPNTYNRTRLQWLASPGVNAPTLVAPRILQRILSVTVDYAALNPNTPLYLSITTGANVVLAIMQSGFSDAAGGTCTFTLGGNPSQLETGGNMITGPLPDIWWDPDLPPTLSVTDFAATVTISNWRVLRQWRELDPDPRP